MIEHRVSITLKPNFFALLFLVMLSLVPNDARAFKIVSALTEGCHEKLTLGTLGRGDPGFVGDRLPSVAPLLTRLIQRAELDGIPQDETSRGLRRENARRYGLERLSEAEQFVYSSFIAGVRAPDTGGYSIVDLNEIRGNHIRDDEQSAHFLRRQADDSAAGDTAVIQETTNRLINLAAKLMGSWSTTGPLVRIERWTFAFYGEKDVTVFGPAYDLGLIAHALQDSYSHALRDDTDLRIIAVANYLDVVRGVQSESRDGPKHSERLDQCNEEDSFDAPRINEARRQTARVFNTIDDQLATNGSSTTTLETVLAQIFEYKSGCTSDNSYCGGTWYKKSLEEISKPYELGCGLMRKQINDHGHHTRGQHPTAAILFMLLPLLIALFMRRKIS